MFPPSSPLPSRPASRPRDTLAVAGAVLALLAGGAGVLTAAVVVPEVPATTVPAPVAQPEQPVEQATDAVSQPLAQLDNATLAQTYGDSVFKVEAQGCGEAGSGSAWVLDEHHLVTNAHVVTIDPNPMVVPRDGSTALQGTVIGAADDPDVAVIRVSEELPAALPWAVTDDLTEGQDLVALGYPAPAADFSVIPSTIVSFQVEAGVREAIRSDGATDYGNSGGPALTRGGAVAGVVTEMLVDPSQLQMVPILFTADALQPTVEGFLADPGTVEADCDSTPPVVPDGWIHEWDADGWDYEEWAGGWEDSLEPEADSYGDDAELDALWDACADGDLRACDDLYWNSAWDSDYETFGSTCGERSSHSYGGCEFGAEQEAAAAEADAAAAAAQEADEEEQRQAEAEAQAALDALVVDCEAGDMQACDDLSWEAAWGSDEEAVGDSCGGHYPDGWSLCVDRAEEAQEIADLLVGCESGDMAACDDLYWASAIGSAEEAVAEDCGGYFPGEGGMCTWAEEYDPGR